MGDPVVFKEGTYEASGDGWSATVHVPHDVRASQMMPALLELAKEVSYDREKSDAA